MNAIEKYIADAPEASRSPLLEVIATIRENAPGASESISYGVATFKLNGKPVVYFAGYDKHIGLYATPNGHAKFETEFSKYKTGKGSVQFPIDQPMPLDLIARVVRYRVDYLSASK